MKYQTITIKFMIYNFYDVIMTPSENVIDSVAMTRFQA